MVKVTLLPVILTAPDSTLALDSLDQSLVLTAGVWLHIDCLVADGCKAREALANGNDDGDERYDNHLQLLEYGQSAARALPLS